MELTHFVMKGKLLHGILVGRAMMHSLMISLAGERRAVLYARTHGIEGSGNRPVVIRICRWW